VETLTTVLLRITYCQSEGERILKTGQHFAYLRTRIQWPFLLAMTNPWCFGTPCIMPHRYGVVQFTGVGQLYCNYLGNAYDSDLILIRLRSVTLRPDFRPPNEWFATLLRTVCTRYSQPSMWASDKRSLRATSWPWKVSSRSTYISIATHATDMNLRDILTTFSRLS